LAEGIINEIKSNLPPSCIVLPYDKRRGVYRHPGSSLKVAHGFGGGNLNACKKMAAAYGSILFGHYHVVDSFAVPGLDRHVGRCIGALCELDQPYNRADINTLRHARGFAYGFLHENGTYQVFQAEEINGQWFLPTEMRDFARKRTPTNPRNRKVASAKVA
jgi:hypothetical protein